VGDGADGLIQAKGLQALACLRKPRFYETPPLPIIGGYRQCARRQVFLCHSKDNAKQKRILEHVKEVFQRLGYAVTLLPLERVV
jgi:hypothetical protein